eukprot:572078-Rhodomonas_salina.1
MTLRSGGRGKGGRRGGCGKGLGTLTEQEMLFGSGGREAGTLKGQEQGQEQEHGERRREGEGEGELRRSSSGESLQVSSSMTKDEQSHHQTIMVMSWDCLSLAILILKEDGGGLPNRPLILTAIQSLLCIVSQWQEFRPVEVKGEWEEQCPGRNLDWPREMC